MKKSTKYLTASVCILLLCACAYALLRPEPVYEKNAEKLQSKIKKLEEREISDLADFTPFAWDRIYSFAPYTSAEEVYQTIGQGKDGLRIQPTVSENMMQVVFLKDGEVVCYLYGYPTKTGLFFDLGDFGEKNHILLQAQSHPAFSVQKFEAGYCVLTLQQ